MMAQRLLPLLLILFSLPIFMVRIRTIFESLSNLSFLRFSAFLLSLFPVSQKKEILQKSNSSLQFYLNPLLQVSTGLTQTFFCDNLNDCHSLIFSFAFTGFPSQFHNHTITILYCGKLLQTIIPFFIRPAA